MAPVVIVATARLRHGLRTQAWQAQGRRAALALKRRREHESAGQLSLDQLADQGGLTEE